MKLVWFPIAGLALLAAIAGWRFGQPVSETQIIEKFADQYIREASGGAARTDCLAVAGSGEVRLTVVCTHSDGTVFRYPAGPRGGLVQNSDTPVS